MRALTIALSLAVSAAVLPAETASERLNETASVFSEIMQTPDKGIPQDLLEKAQCVIFLPGLKKAAFVVGGEYGRGFAECRNPNGKAWGAPAPIKLEGGSVGFQIGGSSTDLVMLVMSQRGMDKLMGDKFTLGADASVAAGPVGRTARAATDVKMDAEILAWSRAKGLFAGVAVNGATIHNDSEGSMELYGRKLSNREILAGDITAPAAASRLNSQLNKYSYRKDSSSAEPHDQ